ncbi:HD family phosphohydrolase [Geotalea uraniireducens]|uniref:HD family phosphohydrolase n=1 Tax=Geotalea uraniireducens TaxID=351604 RepID=A0ABM8ELI5_9BACT|nr:HD domain-containing protein [Geotalea uraniireducens]BDV43302.1 HD family phosphohydrolase [Geotalea uraniireducens]
MHGEELLQKYFGTESVSLAIVLEHSRAVARKALEVARRLAEKQPLDLQFIEEAALLHDIGICETNAAKLGCSGEAPYIVHGILGRQILESEGLPRHALLCERHIGVGLTVDDIVSQNLPLPHREMVPLTTEERIVCYADLFFSKKPDNLSREKSVAEVRQNLGVFGEHKIAIFDNWHQNFNK